MEKKSSVGGVLRRSLVAGCVLGSSILFVACSSTGTGEGEVEEAKEPRPAAAAPGSESGKARLTEADFAAMTDREKLEFFAETFRWHLDDLQEDADRFIVEGDIAVPKEDLEGYVRAYLSMDVEKAYMCNNAGSAPGADGVNCLGMRVTHTNSIRLVTDGSLNAGWRRAFVEAAYVISSMTVANTTTSISIDTTGYRTNQWTITVRADNSISFLALSSWPGFHDSDFVSPGSLILVNQTNAQTTEVRRHAAMHEILHAFGFHHPGAPSTHVAWTGTWTAAGIGCGGGAGTYPTVMCGPGPVNFTFLSADDELGGVLQYIGPTYDRDVWDAGRCTPTSPCGIGEGDCDTDDDCEGYLICSQNSSAGLYGVPSGGDVCVAPPTERGEGAINCNTSFSTSRCDNPACPCGAGEGDCDSDYQCGSVLVCSTNNGPAVGAPADYELCTHPRPVGCPLFNRTAAIDWNLCTSGCPCSYGEGDCDDDVDCVGDLVCAQDVGASFGLQADLDLCVKAGVF